MKKYLPFVSLLVFVTAELFWSRQLRSIDALRPVDTLLFPFAFPVFLLCFVYFLIYFGKDNNARQTWEKFLEDSPAVKWNITAVVALLALGVFLRFWKLDSLFDGITYDESYKGLDAIAIRYFGERPIFLDWNGGREALAAYLVAAAQYVFGLSIFSVRFFPALSGCMALLFFYLFVKKIFSNNVALLSLFLLTVSKYHIIHSRYGVRASLYTFFELVVLYLVAPARGSESHRTRQLALAGFFLGLGFYTYIAYRIFPLVLIAFFFQKTVREDLLKHWKPFLAACAISVLVVMPLGVYYLTHFEEFSDRMKRTEVFKQKRNAPEINPVQVLWKSTADTMAMFTLRGDSIARHNVHNEPMLSSYAAPFFLLGILITLMNIRKPYALFLLLYFLIGLAPGILSVGAPNTPRTLGSLPPALLFVSFGLLGSVQIAQAISPYLGKLLLTLVLAGNFVMGIRDALFRFPQFLDALPARAAETWGMDRDPTDVAAILNNLGSHCEGYVTPQFFFHSTVEYLTYSESRHKLISKHTDPLKSTPKGYVAVIILQPRNMNGWWLRDDDGKNFYKWWAQVYKKRIHEIREVVHQSYGDKTEGILSKVNDRELLDLLKQRFPKGKVIHYGRFDAFVVGL